MAYLGSESDPKVERKESKVIIGNILGIAVQDETRGPMKRLKEVGVTIEAGLAGDFRYCSLGGRVSLLSSEQWRDACTDLETGLLWTLRRANLLVEGMSFGPQYMGRKLYFECGLILEVTGETKPCKRLDEVHYGLQQALTPDWRGGITCRVVSTMNPLKVGHTLCVLI